MGLQFAYFLPDAKPRGPLAAVDSWENPPGLTMPRSAGSYEPDLCNIFEADICLKVNYVSLTTPLPCSD